MANTELWHPRARESWKLLDSVHKRRCCAWDVYCEEPYTLGRLKVYRFYTVKTHETWVWYESERDGWELMEYTNASGTYRAPDPMPDPSPIT